MLPCKLEFRLSSASYKRTLPSSYYFKTAGNGEERGSYRVIFKVGNDLRQDQGKLTKMIFYELLRNTYNYKIHHTYVLGWQKGSCKL